MNRWAMQYLLYVNNITWEMEGGKKGIHLATDWYINNADIETNH